ncbi:unnamed protein product, partial [Ectocarpus sp. 8 AP-2014]
MYQVLFASSTEHKGSEPAAVATAAHLFGCEYFSQILSTVHCCTHRGRRKERTKLFATVSQPEKVGSTVSSAFLHIHPRACTAAAAKSLLWHKRPLTPPTTTSKKKINESNRRRTSPLPSRGLECQHDEYETAGGWLLAPQTCHNH